MDEYTEIDGPRWTEITADDPARAAKFYGDVFGRELNRGLAYCQDVAGNAFGIMQPDTAAK
jgi:hypothetical protein